MRVLLVSTYELGRQPVHVASPAASLRRAGHTVRALDLSVEAWDDGAFEWADAVAFSVYMHTSMRLAIDAARRLRADRPGLPIAFYGLYAPVSRDLVVGTIADRVIAGEYEPGLARWLEDLARWLEDVAAGERGGDDPGACGSHESPGSGERRGGSHGDGGDGSVVVHLGRSDFALPARELLPGLEQYAHLDTGDELRPVGAVEASHGCNQRCRHCPVPAVYDGRTQVLDVDRVMADVAALVDAGARHITFGDPDFLSGPHHARRVLRAFRERFSDLTFDVTTKIEHVLAHRDIMEQLADAGCLFVVSAVESVNDEILRLLDKGHTRAMVSDAVGVLREHGIEPHPSFLPFTPWTTPGDLLDILDFVADHDLVPDVDPVQYSLRLLLPEGSLLLELDEIQPYLDGYDLEGLTHRWHAADPRTDELQREVAALVEAGVEAETPTVDLYAEVREVVASAAGRPEAAGLPPGVREQAQRARPHLTEPWFCCAEPTQGQLAPIHAGT